MRVVLDTNQAASVQRNASAGAGEVCRATIVLPPLVWAEILVQGGYAKSRLSAIAQHDLRFGLDYKECLEALGLLDEERVQAFYPIYRADCDFHRTLSDALHDPPKELLCQANQIKGEYADFIAPLCAKANAMLRKGRADRRTRAESKFSSMDEAMAVCGLHKAKALYAAVIRTCDRHQPVCGVDEFCEAVLANPCLNRFIRLQVCLAIGYCHQWRDGKLNMDVSPDRDDSTDMVITLYARDGDAIATADRKLRAALHHIDPAGSISVGTWDELTAPPVAEGQP
ncbi:MAG: hypothetical protein ACYTKD_10835 [Planctomycetota bacterium]|jgi:hypothetical protein